MAVLAWPAMPLHNCNISVTVRPLACNQRACFRLPWTAGLECASYSSLHSPHHVTPSRLPGMCREWIASADGQVRVEMNVTSQNRGQARRCSGSCGPGWSMVTTDLYACGMSGGFGTVHSTCAHWCSTPFPWCQSFTHIEHDTVTSLLACTECSSARNLALRIEVTQTCSLTLAERAGT